MSHQEEATRRPPNWKSLLGKGALVVGAAVSLFALTLLVNVTRKTPNWLGIDAALAALLLLWPKIVGFLSRIRMWSPQWTLLAGAVPFYALAIWTFFFSSWAMRLHGYEITLVMVCFGSASGSLARKKAYPQFTDRDSPFASLPPPTLFPK
jgi:hypothetical protein